MRSSSNLDFWLPHWGQVWDGLTLRVGMLANTPPDSIILYFMHERSIPNPTSKIERFSPAFCRFRLPFLAFRVMFLTASFSVATRLLALVISAATWWTQFWRRLATLVCRVETFFLAFFHLLDALVFLCGLRFLRRCLEALLICLWAVARNLGLSTRVPSIIATAVKQPISKPTAPVSVERDGWRDVCGERTLSAKLAPQSTVILAYHLFCFQTIVQVVGRPQVLALHLDTFRYAR